MLLEICIEPKDFSLILDPGRLDSRNGIILGAFPLFLEGQIGYTLGKFINQMLINILRNILSLLLLTMIRIGELLGFVIVLLVRIIENMSWQKGDLLWQICLHNKLYLFNINNSLLRINLYTMLFSSSSCSPSIF